ncbi:LysR family transcriptional regulator [Paracoccus aestuariivivens]|uniref:LysR family transcriptional regulator n=1 Tax=Paracoccus aestuariivivens TaxID=1820333 RepID=A0A6L6JFW7_9RHOB|nr:LysR family transcriptional regulator [Paracoccus aestuariivivens]MTH80175.1 LysR family transcriptional regulator [Paracoccus aestuariivivens]
MVKQIDLSRVDINLLVLFEVVLQERHVGRAADRLNLSRSAVSHGLGRLRRLLNDPVFIRTPKGVVPTDRAIELAGAIAEILDRVRSVISTAEPFDPAMSSRRFIIGAPDGVSAVILPPLLETLRQNAPGIDIGLRQLSPMPGETSVERAWRASFTELEAHAMDIAILPVEQIPPRFHRTMLYEEDFAIATRSGHPYTMCPSLEHYCALQHLVVSLAGDPYGFVDTALAELGQSRRIALTVPNFMFALAVLSETDLVAALPRQFVARYAAPFGLVLHEAPLPLPQFRLNAVAPKAALLDAGLVWLLDVLSGAKRVGPTTQARR